jgi:hypothetical protein
MATKTKRSTTNNRTRGGTATATASRTAKTAKGGGNSIAGRKVAMAQMNKGMSGASPKPKPVAKPSRGTNIGGDKPAGGKGGRGC